MHFRVLLAVGSAFVVATSSSCGVTEIPFAPADGMGGDSGGNLGADDLGGAGGTEDLGGAGDSAGGALPTGGQTSIAGGTNGGDGGNGGSGGSPFPSMELLVHAPSKITGLGITGDQVYWTEYGTVDELDNYRFDGVLRTMSVDDEEEGEVLVGGLEGPVSLGVTTAEAYILCDRSTIRASEGASDLVRMLLSGGPVEIVPNHLDYEHLFRMTAFEDRAYFSLKREGGWTVHESRPGESVRQLLPILRILPSVDGSHAYFLDDGLWRQSLDGDAASLPELVSSEKVGATPEGDRLLTTRGKNPTYIASLPKAGGTWTNILRLERAECGGVTVVGSRFATLCNQTAFEPELLTGRLDGSGTQQTYSLSRDQFFAMTEDVLFIAKGRDLYRTYLD